MVIAISKGPKKPDQRPDKPNQDVNDEELTPWQKANLDYLKEKGGEPSWTPKVIHGQEQVEQETLFEEEVPQEEGQRPVTGEETTSFADRLPKLKYQRNSVMYRRLILIVILFMIPLIGVLYYVSPLSKLAKVTVAGTEKVEQNAIITAADFKMDENLWTQYFKRSENVTKIKKAVPRVKSVQVGIQHFNQFHLTVSEFQEVALLAQDNQYSPILENGVVLKDKLKNPTKNMPILENFEKQDKILTLLNQYEKLSPELRSGISQIKYAPTKNNDELLNLFMNDGNQVIVNISNLTKQMKYYPQVAKDLKGKGIIDMEVGIFSYPYPKKEDKQDNQENAESTQQSGEQDIDENSVEN